MFSSWLPVWFRLHPSASGSPEQQCRHASLAGVWSSRCGHGWWKEWSHSAASCCWTWWPPCGRIPLDGGESEVRWRWEHKQKALRCECHSAMQRPPSESGTGCQTYAEQTLAQTNNPKIRSLVIRWTTWCCHMPWLFAGHFVFVFENSYIACYQFEPICFKVVKKIKNLHYWLYFSLQTYNARPFWSSNW